jgi:putative polyketide hydroxylase
MTGANPRVCIVGGGPCGLFLGLLLARFAVPCLIIERKSGLSMHPKAMGISRRTAEIFRQIGLHERLEAGSLSLENRHLAVWSKTLVGEELGRVPFTDLHSPLTPCTGMHSPQTWTETVLRDAVRAEPLADLRFGHDVQHIEPGASEVALEFWSPAGSQRLAVPWVVAADGAGSAVRHALAINAQGPGDMGHFLNVLFRAPLGKHLHDRPALLYNVVSGTFMEFFVAVNGDDLWLMHHFLDEHETPADFSPARIEDMIHTASGLPNESVEVLGVSPWVMSPKVAESFRAGRVLLTGDAAARLSPAGGLGLNTGLQSAHNLAWKLAAVIHGQAPETLLDSYHDERHAAALQTMEQTNKNAGELFEIVEHAMSNDWDAVRNCIAHSRRGGSHLGQDLGISYQNGAFLTDGTPAPQLVDPVNDYIPSARPGSRAPHIALVRDGAPISTLDLLGDTFVLLTSSNGHAWSAAASAWTGAGPASVRCLAITPSLSDSITDPSDAFPSAYGIDTAGAVLIRPDGYVAARFPSATGNEPSDLKAALESILTG